MMQAYFVCDLIDVLKENGIHVAVQTSGYAGEKTFKKVIDKLDYNIDKLDYNIVRKYRKGEFK